MLTELTYYDKGYIATDNSPKSNKISSLNVGGSLYDIGLSEETKSSLFEEFLQHINKVKLQNVKCVNCGGAVKMEYNKGIFICPYCGSHYVIGAQRIYDKG